VSIIVPCYNARGKIEKCLASLRQVDAAEGTFDVIFVDDCSSDGTFEYLQEEAAGQPHWRAHRLASNSGSPSRPRNVGTRLSEADFIFFLDCDDVIYPDTIRTHLQHAVSHKADIVRGYLIVDDGSREIARNTLADWKASLPETDRIALIIAKQSTTTPSLIRRSLLIDNDIMWPEDIRIGEDTLFLIDVLSHAAKVEYIDHPTFIYHKSASWTPSSTQRYGARELKNHLQVWEEAESRLATRSISFCKIRLQVGLQTVLKSLMWFNTGDIPDETYQELTAFLRKHWDTIRNYTYGARYREIVETIHKGDVEAIRSILKPRLVISGYDLKFARQVEPMLAQRFDIRFDEWTGHAAHDEKQSLAMRDWAEIVWCEWLLENAVWWSTHKRANQVLVTRMHRFELGRDFGHRAKIDAINCIFCVSVYYFEKLIETFGFDRQKVRLLPNPVDTSAFNPKFDEARLKNLAIIGTLPSRKGLLRALEILARLRETDPDFRLHVFGKQAAEVSWVAKDPVEGKYFEACTKYIADHGLQDAVIHHGHADIAKALYEHKIGFVLSVSDREAPESFHLAPAEGFAGGAQGVFLDWEGVEYIYPEKFIKKSVAEISDYILAQQAPDTFKANARLGREFIETNYSGEKFLDFVMSAAREFC
ncbi:MAG: glycosyl transferase, partial [Hyphomonas sp.]|nr:glycosyl transferase [Hyphomonas sp.]